VDTLFFDTRETRFVIVLILQDRDGVSSEAGFGCAENGIVVMMMLAINFRCVVKSCREGCPEDAVEPSWGFRDLSESRLRDGGRLFAGM
jgi:hypothetical protein